MSKRFNIISTIFIVGFPRSGTTWFSNLINSHPRTVYRHEAIGRDYLSFGDELMERLKHANGLSAENYEAALDVLLKAKISTDKPPFFRKDHNLINDPKLQKFLWLLAKAAPPLEPVYSVFFTPSRRKGLVAVVKETRSSMNLASIIKGIRADKVIILARHPYGVIASHLQGRARGDMKFSNAGLRRRWFQANAGRAYLRENGIDETYILNATEVEYLALRWRLRHEDYLEIHRESLNSQVLIYESFLRDTEKRVRALLNSIGLKARDQVMRFVYESSHTNVTTNLMKRDAASEFYSVFRSKGFNPNKWKEILSENDLSLIDRHTEAIVKAIGLHYWIECL